MKNNIDNIKQLFILLSEAFPLSNIRITGPNGNTIARQEYYADIEEDDFYRITKTLAPDRQLLMEVRADGYKDETEAERMLDSLLSMADFRCKGMKRREFEDNEEKRLLRILFYADSMEMRIYAVLLAEKLKKEMALERVVCVIESRYKETDGMTELLIPNKEIRWIFVQQIRKWFKEETLRDVGMLENFCLAFQKNDVTAIERGFNGYLQKTISIRDTNAPKGMKENFYHGLLLGLLGNMHGWTVRSNAESGEGYSDILIETASGETGIVIELKYAENAAFDAACETAMRQIKDREYEEVLVRDGMKTIYRYGIACYKKRCKVIGEKR